MKLWLTFTYQTHRYFHFQQRHKDMEIRRENQWREFSSFHYLYLEDVNISNSFDQVLAHEFTLQQSSWWSQEIIWGRDRVWNTIFGNWNSDLFHWREPYLWRGQKYMLTLLGWGGAESARTFFRWLFIHEKRGLEVQNFLTFPKSL